MNSWAADTPAGELAEKARRIRPGRAPAVVAGWAKASWPQVVKAGSVTADAIVAVFIAAGCVLGFGVYCINGIVFGFCLAAGIPQPGELIARRRAARQQAPGAQQPPKVLRSGW